MMRRIATLACALALAACEPAEMETDAESATEQPTSEEMIGTGAFLAQETLPGGGAYLTAADGRALYTLEGTDDPSACVDECAEAWPPFIRADGDVSTADAAAGGLQPRLIGTVQRPDGTSQVTYGGHPLYFYTRDTERGQTAGQDVTDEWGEWYLVQPTGELQEEEGAAGDAGDAAASADGADGAAASQTGASRSGY
jgi:predicted lipoprotein with Yx(FWY)xxD motif